MASERVQHDRDYQGLLEDISKARERRKNNVISLNEAKRRKELRSQTGYRRRLGMRGGNPAVVAPNHLQRQFTAAAPNQSWVADITHIRTHEGWL